MSFRHLLILFFLGKCFTAPAQEKYSGSYRIERFTTDNGLNSNGIKGLQWDETTGFLWIATEAGVTRYDGAHFLTFSKANTPGFTSDRMLFLFKNRGGRIYTADETGNIFFVMQNRLQFLGQVKIDARPSTFRLIGLVASGKMFRQSSEQPAPDFGFYFKRETMIPVSETRIILFRKDTVYDYQQGKVDPVPVTTVGNGSKAFSIGGQIFIYDGRKGFLRLDTERWNRETIPFMFEKGHTPGSSPWQLFWESGMRNPILIAGHDAWLLSYGEGRLTARSICDAVPTDAQLSFAGYDEKSGIFFLGTNSKGIIIIRKNSIRPVKVAKPSNDKQTSTYTQLGLPGGAILTSDGDILGGTPAPSSFRPIRGVFNNFIYTDPDSVLWYSEGDSIYSYAYRTGKTRMIRTGKGSITSGFVHSDSSLYIANAVGIGVLRGDGMDYLYRYPRNDINNNVPFAMLELSPGVLTIGSCNGLFAFDIRKRRLDTLLHLPGTCVRALWKYKDYLFIGTYGKGIYIWKNGVLKPIPVDKNNYLEYAHCFVPDKLGFCWISCNKGLFRARPSDMAEAFEKGDNMVYYHYYGRNDGMDITELNGGCTPCALSLDDTIVSFPSMDGLVWVDANRPLTHLPGGAIYIDAFMADGKKQNVSSLLRPTLPSGTRELSFSLSYPAWVNKENIYIEYKLEPYWKEWRPLDIQNTPTVNFSNLPPGNYVLKVRKLNGFGENNYAMTESSFRIDTYWYQQPWTWLLGLCLLTGLIVWIVGMRTRRFQVSRNRLEQQIAIKTRELKQKNEELERTDLIKTRLISIISHDLVTPLKFLHLAGKSLIEKKDELPDELQKETITEIMNTSKELELLSTNILNWIKYRNEDRRLAKESFNLHLLVRQLFGLFNSMAKQKQIQLINQVDEQLSLYQFIEPVKIVLYNLVLNGINFSSEGYIRVSSEPAPEGITLIIEDTGVGMTQEQINNIMADHFIISSANVDRRKGNGLGYLIIKDLLKIIRGNLVIQSEKNKGTCVRILLPVPSALTTSITL
ncbi:MAG TPA: ATP-binding protein [Puia sp.]|nr:ATP-binding protein [Puia sp.]